MAVKYSTDDQAISLEYRNQQKIAREQELGSAGARDSPPDLNDFEHARLLQMARRWCSIRKCSLTLTPAQHLYSQWQTILPIGKVCSVKM